MESQMSTRVCDSCQGIGANILRLPHRTILCLSRLGFLFQCHHQDPNLDHDQNTSRL